MEDELHLLLGFDFYGAGNIGDDLMLKGFWDVFSKNNQSPLSCILPCESCISSQKKRFREIEWCSGCNDQREKKLAECDGWLGVGGTPFQASSGRWLLDKISKDFTCIPNKKKWMIGVGCEEEVLLEKEISARIAVAVDHIWTRDEKSRELLIGPLGIDRSQVTLGADLANISLKNIFGVRLKQTKREYHTGIVYYSENYNSENLSAIKNFASKLSQDNKLIFLANDVRRKKGFEHAVYNKMFGRLRGFWKARPLFFAPDYDMADLRTLVERFLECKTIMASRYHAILTAAWAGCRLVALDRNSKIRNLANELDIPLIKAPFSADSLYEGYCNAKTVPRELLEEKALAAEKSVIDLCSMIY